MKQKGKKAKNYKFHCGRTDYKDADEKEESNGWCATEEDNNEKIKSWGYCSKECKPKEDGFMYANMNILTDEEAVELLKNNGKQKHEVKGGKIVLGEFKMFAGKKHTLPAKMIVVKRKQKPKKMFEKQQKEAKEFGMKLEPTNYKYQH